MPASNSIPPGSSRERTAQPPNSSTVMVQARMAGAVIAKPAENTFYGGYAGYFQDPDGHLWEIAWNPAWDVGG